MSSIGYMKLKTRSDVRGVLRHCDTKLRMQDEHANADIDKSKTHLNMQFLPTAFVDTYNRFTKMIRELDSLPGSNRRKDRVEAFALTIPYPEEISLDPKRWHEYGDWLMKWCASHYKVVNSYIHFDEVHEYVSHGEVKKSRPHLHAIVVPEVDGKLCGKRFSSPTQMSAMNRQLDADIQHEFGVRFLTHEEPREKKVEQLKLESYKELTEDVQKRLNQLHELQDFESMRKLYLEYYGKAFDITLEEMERTKKKEVTR